MSQRQDRPKRHHRTFAVLTVAASLLAASAHGQRDRTEVYDYCEETSFCEPARWMNRAVRTVWTAFRLDKARQRLTPAEAHALGRGAAAAYLSRHPIAEDPSLQRYVNLVGRSVAAASTRPEVFDGYRFVLVESDAVQALALPDAIVLITRGLARLAGDEDTLAAALAHEIAHVEHHDARKAIRNRRWRAFWRASLLTALFETGGIPDMGGLSTVLSGMADELTDVLETRGHARAAEHAADAAAARLLSRAGYDPYALVELMTKLESIGANRSSSLLSTHPPAHERLARLRTLLSGPVPRPPARTARYTAALGAPTSIQTNDDRP